MYPPSRGVFVCFWTVEFIVYYCRVLNYFTAKDILNKLTYTYIDRARWSWRSNTRPARHSFERLCQNQTYQYWCTCVYITIEKGASQQSNSHFMSNTQCTTMYMYSWPWPDTEIRGQDAALHSKMMSKILVRHTSTHVRVRTHETHTKNSLSTCKKNSLGIEIKARWASTLSTDESYIIAPINWICSTNATEDCLQFPFTSRHHAAVQHLTALNSHGWKREHEAHSLLGYLKGAPQTAVHMYHTTSMCHRAGRICFRLRRFPNALNTNKPAGVTQGLTGDKLLA